ncbi:MAG: AAA family ATPase [Candidatus Binataceae bacterium]
MAIIAMTQHLGTHYLELGRLTAERLGYRFFTADEAIAEASRDYHIPPEQLVITDERRPHFWERLKTDTERFVQFVRVEILRAMAADRLVVVGRSVTHMLPEPACGLRVRLTGPLKERVQAVAADEKLAPAVAERRVRDYDREMRARIQTLFDVDMDEPGNFNLVLNTFTLPLETLAGMLAGLATEIDRTVTPESWRRLRDAALAAEVSAALMVHPKIGRSPLEVQCAAGVVQVNGPGLVPPWDLLISDVARRVEGVRAVEVTADEQPIAVRPN